MSPLLKDIKQKPFSTERAEIYRRCLYCIQQENINQTVLEQLEHLGIISYNVFDEKYNIISRYILEIQFRYIKETVKEIKEQINLDALLLTIEEITGLLQYYLFEEQIYSFGRIYSFTEYLEKINLLLSKKYFKNHITEELIAAVMHPKNLGRLWNFEE
jgi:hypothetical protein